MGILSQTYLSLLVGAGPTKVMVPMGLFPRRASTFFSISGVILGYKAIALMVSSSYSGRLAPVIAVETSLFLITQAMAN
jgi:hypothetical protein